MTFRTPVSDTASSRVSARRYARPIPLDPRPFSDLEFPPVTRSLPGRLAGLLLVAGCCASAGVGHREFDATRYRQARVLIGDLSGFELGEDRRIVIKEALKGTTDPAVVEALIDSLADERPALRPNSYSSELPTNPEAPCRLTTVGEECDDVLLCIFGPFDHGKGGYLSPEEGWRNWWDCRAGKSVSELQAENPFRR